MRTAVDTNVLIDVLARADEAADQAMNALLMAGTHDQLVLSIVCYAELAHRFVSRRALDGFVSGLQLEVASLTESQAFAAGKFYEDYRRRGGTRQRILPDFLVGAHALLDADRLLTSDARFYGPAFPKLKRFRLPNC